MQFHIVRNFVTNKKTAFSIVSFVHLILTLQLYILRMHAWKVLIDDL